jgi:prefoldin alpha subunit
MSEAQATTLSAEQLTIPQLQQQKQILEQEVSHLTDTVAKLKAAQQAYDMSSKSLGTFTPDNEDREILLPLCNSVYVPGRAKDVKRVLLNVGTGYFAEMSTDAAKNHCLTKGGMLSANVNKFAKMLAQKRSHLETCMKILQLKLAQQQQRQSQ